MKKVVYLFFGLLCLFTTASSQTRVVDITILDYVQDVNVSFDSNDYRVYKIDSSSFEQLLSGDNNIVIQFWQPWCGGVSNWIDRINQIKKSLDSLGITFVLISDFRYGEDYLINDSASKQFGLLTYYFNKYKIDFPTYIIPKKSSLDDYKKIMSEFLNQNVNTNKFCFLIKSKKILIQEYSQKFYKVGFEKRISRKLHQR